MGYPKPRAPLTICMGARGSDPGPRPSVPSERRGLPALPCPVPPVPPVPCALCPALPAQVHVLGAGPALPALPCPACASAPPLPCPALPLRATLAGCGLFDGNPCLVVEPTPIHLSSALLCNVVVSVSNSEGSREQERPPWGEP